MSKRSAHQALSDDDDDDLIASFAKAAAAEKAKGPLAKKPRTEEKKKRAPSSKKKKKKTPQTTTGEREEADAEADAEAVVAVVRRPREPKPKAPREPNSSVSLVVMVEERSNFHMIETICWPEIELSLPCLEVSEVGLPRCELCANIHSLFVSWYELHPDKLAMADQTRETSLTDREDRTDPRTHDHDVTINGMYELEMPDLTEKMVRAARKPKPLADLEKELRGGRGGGDEEEEEDAPSLREAAERVFGERDLMAATKQKKPDGNGNGDDDIDNAWFNRAKQQIADSFDGGDDVDMDVVPSSPAKQKQQQQQKQTENPAAAAAAGAVSEEQLSLWIKKTIKYLRDEFKTETTYGRKNPRRKETTDRIKKMREEEGHEDAEWDAAYEALAEGTMPIVPKPHQQVMADHVAKMDWAAEYEAVERDEKDNERFLVDWEQGSGKCWGRGTKLLLYDGSTKCVEDIVPGDVLMGDDNTPRTVQPQSCVRNRGEMYRVTSKNAGRDTWTCNAKHILVVKCDTRPSPVVAVAKESGGASSWCYTQWEIQGATAIEREHSYPTKDEASAAREQAAAEWEPLIWEGTVLEYLELIQHFHGRTTHMYSPTLVQFSKPSKSLALVLADAIGSTPDDAKILETAWILGLWFADDNTVDEFEQWYARVFPEHGKHNMAPVESRNALKSVLMYYGAPQRKHALGELNRESESVRLALLAGLIDAHGRRYFDETMCSYELPAVVVDLCRGLGFRTGPIGQERFRLDLQKQKQQLARLAPYLTTELSSSSSSSNDDDLLCDGFSIEPIGVDDFYGFSLDGNGRCLLGDYVVTHNTDGIIYPWQENPPERVVYVVGNTVIAYWSNKIAAYPQTSGSTRHEVVGYTEFAKRVRDNPDYLSGAVLVMDEAHIYRRVTSAMVPVLQAFARAIAVFNLTGTPLMNQAGDWTGLEMYMGLRPVHDMSSIKKDPELEKLHALPTKGVEFRRLYEALKHKVFFYQPEMPIPTQRIDIKVPMTWCQTLEYWYNHSQRPTIGRLGFTTSNRNSFESMSRRVANCVMMKDDDQKVDYSPKFDAVVEYIRVAFEKKRLTGDGSDLPIVIYSQYLARGVYAVYQYLKRQPWAHELRIAMVGGESQRHAQWRS